MYTGTPYTEQWQKITEAYMRDEIEPYNCRFCFCGTLAKGIGWAFESTCNNMEYTYGEFRDMERALLHRLTLEIPFLSGEFRKNAPNYESALFKGMCDALEVLRQIHEEKGDPTAKEIVLEKRILTVN